MFLMHTPPERAPTVARAVVAACRGQGWPSEVQPKLLHTLFNELLNHDFDFHTLEPNTLEEVAAALPSPEERQELIQLMCAMEMLCDAVPAGMEASVARWAEGLHVADRSLRVLRELARGQMRQSMEDFYRLNWIGDLSRRDPGFDQILKNLGPESYAQTIEADPEEHKRWARLAACPDGSLGHHLHTFYKKRGFLLPGEAGAASAAVAHHDWIHLVTDYGTTPLGEIEVVSFMAANCQTSGMMLGLLGALALFESGAFEGSFVTAGVPHQGLSRPGGNERMADAIKRGKACKTNLVLDVDFFSMADEPLCDVRERFELLPKSENVRAVDQWGALELEPTGAASV